MGVLGCPFADWEVEGDYVAGFQVWGSKAEQISGFARLRYTGLPSLLPAAMQAGSQGILLHFDEALDEDAARQALDETEARLGIPAVDPMRTGVARIVDALG